MQSLTQPELLLKPFAESGDKNTLPVTNTDASNPQLADLTNGFPQVTSEDPDDGGLPPERKDFNGLGYLTTTYDFFAQAGGTYTFNDTVSTAIGGYPVGARLWYDDGNGHTAILKSTIQNNTYNFNSDSSYIGNQWVAETPVLNWDNKWNGQNTYTDRVIFINGTDSSYAGVLYKDSTNILTFGISNQNNSSLQNYIRFLTNGTISFTATNITGITPSSATDNSTKIPTTAWVRNHRCTTAATTTSSASVDAPAYIVQNYRSGTDWYRVWSDGWIEQGGRVTGVALGGNGTRNLKKAFATDSYALVITCGCNTTAAGFDTGTNGFINYTHLTTTNFKWKANHTSSAYYANTFSYYACGY